MITIEAQDANAPSYQVLEFGAHLNWQEDGDLADECEAATISLFDVVELASDFVQIPHGVGVNSHLDHPRGVAKSDLDKRSSRSSSIIGYGRPSESNDRTEAKIDLYIG